jgi:DNA-binding transcriptional MerR regulator
MLVQLNLFGEEPANEPKKVDTPKPKKYKLVPPPVVEVAEEKPVVAEEKPVEVSIKETEPQAIDFEEPFIVTKEKAKKKSSPKTGVSSNQVQEILNGIPSEEVLKEKLYYPISDVASMFKVNISLVRFWEKEFDILKPRKNRKGDRLFRPEDIKNLKLIYFLLREKKYTIKGAKSYLKKGKNAFSNFEAIETLGKIRQMLVELKAELQ